MSKKKPTLGVIFCDCGGENARVLDFKHLQDVTSKMPDVKFVKKHSSLCLEGPKEVGALVRKGANRILVAACSPKLYETYFRNCLEKNKLNPYCLEMANIREQCAWPHVGDRKGANEKALRLVTAGVERARRIMPVEKKEFKVQKSVLVIGGGVAGLQTSFDIAAYGFPVHLVERAPVLGGNALKIGLAFPNDDGAFCISSPGFLKGIRKCFYRAGVLQNPNLRLYTLSEVKDVKGSFGNFEVKVGSQPRGVKENLCINCGKCGEVCPVESEDEFNYGFGKRKAIYLPYPNAVPPVWMVDWENCTKCGECIKICPTNAIDLKDEAKETTLKVGGIVVATGFKEYDPSGITAYRYGVDKDVLTQLQLARIIDPYGPTGGRLVRPSDGKTPEKIVMIQCAGSRDETTNPYCSGICCTLAIKHAIQIKKRYGQDVELYICYIDIRTGGKEYEDYFVRAREAGVSFIRGKPSRIVRNPESGKLHVQVEESLLNTPVEIEADMVVLSVAMRPEGGTDELAKLLNIDLDDYGFVREVYGKLKPVQATRKGIYVCGGAQGPKNIPQSVTQAQAASLRAILDLAGEKAERELDLAYVNDEACDGCELCVEVCPHNAIEMAKVKEKTPVGLIAKISEALCERCGACAARCPTGAIQLPYWNDEQFLGQISGLMPKSGGDLSPKVVAFCCDECGYATVDLTGMGKMSYPTNVLPIRVPCLGWVSLYHIFKTFEHGADGVLFVGCMFPHCQQLKGNIYAEQAITFAREILDEIGLGSKRLNMVNVCAADPKEFSVAAESFVEELKELGPVIRK